MKIKIRAVSFVTFSDLADGLEDDAVTQIANSIAQDVTWGDACHTLVSPAQILTADAVVDGESDDIVELRRRVKLLPPFTLIDMEN